MLIRIDTLAPWRGEPLNGIKHPKHIETLWSVEELATIGLVQVVKAVIPEGHRTVGEPSWDATGQEFRVTELIPPPTPEELSVEDARELDGIFSKRVLVKTLFGLAKQTRPTLTMAEFREWIEGLS